MTIGLVAALVCLVTVAPLARAQQREVPPALLRLKSSALQPQSLRGKLLPREIDEVDRVLARYAKKRAESRRRRVALSDRETKAFLIELAVKGYELSQRATTGARPSAKETAALAQELRSLSENKAVTDPLRNLAVQLSSGRAGTAQVHASKKDGAAKGAVETVEGAASAAVETAGNAAGAVASKGEETATRIVSAVEAVVSWLTS